MKPNQRECAITRADMVVGLAMVFLLVWFYAFFTQANLTWDGAFFLHEELSPVSHYFATHMIFGPWLRLALAVGRECAVKPLVAGSIQSAVTMACALGLYFAAQRRCGVGRAVAVVFTMLLACSAPFLENATSVEVYGLSIFALMLSLHSFISEARHPCRRGASWLVAANIFVVWAHVGFSFWVLSLYLALAISERRYLLRIAQGFAVLLALLATHRLANAIGLSETNHFGYMYGRFFQNQSLWSHLGKMTLAPMDSFHAFAGLSVFPAVLGWRIQVRRFPALAVHAILVSLLFFGFYHAWTVDLGTFYMPVMMVWGVYAALGCESALRSEDRIVKCALAGLAVFLIAGAVLPWQPITIWPWVRGDSHRVWLGVLFYVFLGAQWMLAGRVLSRGPMTRQAKRLWPFAWTGAAFALTFFCFLPRSFLLLNLDADYPYEFAFWKLTQGTDLRRERLITRLQSDRIEMDLGVEALSSDLIGSDHFKRIGYDHNVIAEWIRGGARPIDPLRVWVDAESLPVLRKSWNHALKDIPIDALSFRPVTIECGANHSMYFTFYQIGFHDPGEARRHGLGLDPYPVENWAGTPVMWTRPAYEQKVHREGEWLGVKYWVGHPGMGPARHVRVEIRVNGIVVHNQRHEKMGVASARVRLPASIGRDVTLSIRVTPGWCAPEGRELGVGLYPFKWEE